jgi:hypothetical protein
MLLHVFTFIGGVAACASAFFFALAVIPGRGGEGTLIFLGTALMGAAVGTAMFGAPRAIAWLRTFKSHRENPSSTHGAADPRP